MFRAAVVLLFASVLLAALAIISCLSVEDRSRLRSMPRWAWVLVILLAPTVGPVAYFLWGRPLPEGTPRAWLLGGGEGPPRPHAPDDDPDFLRSLRQEPGSGTLSSDDEKLLRQWEEDLKRREDEHRKGNGDA